jgi:hypothetical protein
MYHRASHALEALDPDVPYDDRRRREMLARFLKGLDWRKNPFLRSPAAMKKLGFEGKPYELAPARVSRR